ncbi:uncharacterized protein LOC123707755, partial [Pieris brassicae]|uniref:uncharacterized protein LOC123707755 n=1 Tax=Pieris brassicae TaxID=7116 RepID=UPI001E65F1DC
IDIVTQNIVSQFQSICVNLTYTVKSVFSCIKVWYYCFKLLIVPSFINQEDSLELELSESQLALKESLCRSTLVTVAALGLGDTHLRGLLLYHLHAALAERARRFPDLYEELKAEIESTIEQSYNILKGDISSPPDLELRHQYLGLGSDKPHEERFFILDKKPTP